MSKLKLGLALLCFLYAINSCNSKKTAIINYDRKVIDLGTIEFKKAYVGTINLYNIGDGPLQLLNATADCSCTLPEKLRHIIIQPNESYPISFTLTPMNNGFIQQNIYLDNNSVNESRVLFLIRAYVKLIDE